MVSQYGGPRSGGTLSITFGFPQAAFMYQATTPRLTIDGSGVPVQGWGTLRVPVAPGSHDVRVWIPYAFPRRAGKARTEVTVPAGGSAELEYMAPTVTFRGGSLGKPGEQKSAGYSGVMIANVVAVVAVVILIVLAVALR